MSKKSLLGCSEGKGEGRFVPRLVLAVGIPPWQVRGVRKAEQTGCVCVCVSVADPPCLCVPTAAWAALHPQLLGCTIHLLAVGSAVCPVLGIHFGQSPHWELSGKIQINLPRRAGRERRRRELTQGRFGVGL